MGSGNAAGAVATEVDSAVVGGNGVMCGAGDNGGAASCARAVDDVSTTAIPLATNQVASLEIIRLREKRSCIASRQQLRMSARSAHAHLSLVVIGLGIVATSWRNKSG
jgi:hypothetical protein